MYVNLRIIFRETSPNESMTFKTAREAYPFQTQTTFANEYSEQRYENPVTHKLRDGQR